MRVLESSTQGLETTRDNGYTSKKGNIKSGVLKKSTVYKATIEKNGNQDIRLSGCRSAGKQGIRE
jgi:hypothetical protein